MSAEAWVFLTTEVTVLGGIITAYFQFRKPMKKLGNGFADDVRSELTEIKALALEARDEIRNHKEQHVAASLKVVK